MTDLSDLYQQIIVEHNRAPRNFRKLTHPTREAEGAASEQDGVRAASLQ